MKTKVNLEKQIERLVKRGLTKRASELQDYLFNKNRRFHGVMSYKLEDFKYEGEKELTPEELKEFQKEYRTMDKKHLRAYLKGARTFQHGIHRIHGIPHPNVYPVLDKPIEEIKKEMKAFEETQKELEEQRLKEAELNKTKDDTIQPPETL